MLSTPLICCSIGVATDCSMVTASAPVNVVARLICGGMICGNWAMGRPSSVTEPSSTATVARTIATMGRRMKNAEIMSAPLGLGRRARDRRRIRRRGHRLRDHDRAVGDLLHALDDDLIFLVHARRDDPLRARIRPDLDLAQADL